MSINLTASIRSTIISGVIKHKHEAIVKQKADALDVLFLRDYKNWISKHLPHMNALPKEFFQSSAELVLMHQGKKSCEVIGQSIWVTTPGNTMNLLERDSVKVLQPKGGTYEAVRYCTAGSDTFEAIEDLDGYLSNTVRPEVIQLENLLRKFRTAKQLVAAWPEVASFVPTELKVTLPAIRTDELNAQFGLPVEVSDDS